MTAKEKTGVSSSVALVENVSRALWLEASVVDLVMHLLPDCDSFKSALALAFELAFHVNPSLFDIMLFFPNHFP